MNLPLDRAQAPNRDQHRLPSANCLWIWPQKDVQAVGPRDTQCFKVDSQQGETVQMKTNKLIVVMVATSAVQDAGMSSRLLCMVSTVPRKKIPPLSWTHESLAHKFGLHPQQVLEVLRSSASRALPGSHADGLFSPHPSSPVRGLPYPGVARKLVQTPSVLPYLRSTLA